jgi:hypothetical protein
MMSTLSKAGTGVVWDALDFFFAFSLGLPGGRLFSERHDKHLPPADKELIMFTTTVKTLTLALIVALVPMAAAQDTATEVDNAFTQVRQTVKDQTRDTLDAMKDAEANSIDAAGSGDFAAAEDWKKQARVHELNADDLESAYARLVALQNEVAQFATELEAKKAKVGSKGKQNKKIEDIDRRFAGVASMFTKRLADYTNATEGDIPSTFMIQRLVEGVDWLEYQAASLKSDLKAV